MSPASSVAPSSLVKHHPSVLEQTVDGTLMLYQMEEGRYFALEAVGMRIWELCDGTRLLSDVAAVLAEEFDAPAAVICEDVLNLVRELSDESLLVACDA